MNMQGGTISKKHGSALVFVLWLIVIMTMVVTVTAKIGILDSKISHLAVERIRCKWTARAGVETAVALLLADDKNTDTLKDLWAENPDQLQNIQMDSCRFSVRVIDESGKLMVNNAKQNQLMAFPGMTADISDSILDWKDKDQDLRAGGAEEGYYINLPNGYSCRNARFETIRELLLVKGVTEDLLYGPEGVEGFLYTQNNQMAIGRENLGWIHYLTPLSLHSNRDKDNKKRINVNSAEEGTLRKKLSISKDQAKWIVNNREFKKLSDLMGKKSNTKSKKGSGKGENNNAQNQGKPLDWSTLLKVADKATFSDSTFVYGRVNVNTANVQTLQALFEGNQEIAEGILSHRQLNDTGIQNFTELGQVAGITESTLKNKLEQVGFRSSVYRIHSIANSDATGQKYAIEAILNRDSKDGRVLYWRQQPY